MGEKKRRVKISDIRGTERITGESFTHSERKLMVTGLTAFSDRREQRLKVDLPNDLHPGCIFTPIFNQSSLSTEKPGFVPSNSEIPQMPESDTDIAFAPITYQSHWIKSGALTCIRLTDIYLTRIKNLGETLECLVTLLEESARAGATELDDELAAGAYRGPLHGIPWGAKDLLDTAGVPTTWGAAPYRERVPDSDARIVEMLHQAGAVLIAKLTLGALANGDVWFGGTTKNPWNVDEGSSGSSAGPAAATAAGLVGFAIGSETLGSIVSPSARCGAVGLRPTYGRVSRTGAMALCWSLDKIGPICRHPDDAGLVMSIINGHDPSDPGSVDVPFGYGSGTPDMRTITVGYDPAWFEQEPTNATDGNVMELVKHMGCKTKEIALPDWPYSSLMTIVSVEAAAAFEELTLSDRDDQLTRQDAEAWPNIFRTARLIPAIEFIQADRLRRKVMMMMEEIFHDVDLLISPPFSGPLLIITNFTGHPSLTVTSSFAKNEREAPETPRAMNVYGKPFDEATLCRFGYSLEKALGVEGRRPPAFT